MPTAKSVCKSDVHAGYGSGGIPREPRGAATGRERRDSSRVAACIEQQSRDCGFAAGICDRRFARQRVTTARRGGNAAHFSRGGGLPAVGEEQAGYLRFERRWHKELAGSGEAGGRREINLNKHGGNHCGGSAGASYPSA